MTKIDFRYPYSAVMEYDAEQCECAHRWLDDHKVPRTGVGGQLSLVGRIMAYGEMREHGMAKKIPDAGRGQLGESIEYGDLVERFIDDEGQEQTLVMTRNLDPVMLERWLRSRARDELPAGTRYELRAKIPSNYGRTRGMAWYREAAMDKVERWGEGKFPRHAPEGGYVLLGQFVTPPRDLTGRALPSAAAPDGVTPL